MEEKLQKEKMGPSRRSVLLTLIATPFIVRASSLDGLSFLHFDSEDWITYNYTIQEPFHYSRLPGIGIAKTGDSVKYRFNTLKHIMKVQFNNSGWIEVKL